MNSLELGLVGNGSFGALLDARGRVVWCCLPAFDGDPAFCALLEPKIDGGEWAVELEDFASSEQHYLPNTAILRTLLTDAHSGTVEHIDVPPRWPQHARSHPPVMHMRPTTPLP